MRDLMEYPNVVGYGRGRKWPYESVTKVLVRQKMPLSALAAKDVVPAYHRGFPTDVIEVGHIRAFQAPTGRFRPAPGGVSIGHKDITAGTLGTIVRDASDEVGFGALLILSNNHVLANSNEAVLGDAILQPGPYDGGVAADQIATLLRFQPVIFSTSAPTCPVAGGLADLANLLARLVGSQHRLQAVKMQAEANLVDAAVARPLDQSLVERTILGIGPTPQESADAYLGQTVRKSGRTTGVLTGVVSVLDATVTVDYGAGRTALFEHQAVAGPMSQPGDSGSLIVSDDGSQAIGLLFAGSDKITIFNPIRYVLEALKIVL